MCECVCVWVCVEVCVGVRVCQLPHRRVLRLSSGSLCSAQVLHGPLPLPPRGSRRRHRRTPGSDVGPAARALVLAAQPVLATRTPLGLVTRVALRWLLLVVQSPVHHAVPRRGSTRPSRRGTGHTGATSSIPTPGTWVRGIGWTPTGTCTTTPAPLGIRGRCTTYRLCLSCPWADRNGRRNP